MTPPVSPRARDLGIAIGTLPAGPLDAITDVAGVAVGHATLIRGDAVRTGVTAVLPHAGNPFRDRVPAGIAVGNGFGKLAGATQLQELGELETPVLLTNTLSVAAAIDGAVDWTLARPGNHRVASVNAVVGETQDGFLNDIRGRHVTPADAIAAIEAAAGGPVAEGCVGAGTGTRAFAWKGGIGTASRIAATSAGPFTVGALVQTNYGGRLTVAGVPIDPPADPAPAGDGSVMILLATDAPLSDRNLARLAWRGFLGIARTGSWMANGSGDYAIAFSTAETVRRTPARRRGLASLADLANDAMSPLFQAAAEAVETSVLNAMLAATTMIGIDGHRLEAITAARILAALDRR